MPVFKLRVRLISVLGYFAYGFVFRYAVAYICKEPKGFYVT